MSENYADENDAPWEDDFDLDDPDWDRVCSYPCHICGETDEEWEDDE